MANHRRSSPAFTLIEVTFAILILAGALVTLLGLQSASIQRSVRDHNKQQAMLIARQIFSAIETSLAADKGGLDNGQISDTPDRVINEILPEYSNSTNRLDPENRFTVTLNVGFWPIPYLKLDTEAVRRIFLTIAWGNSSADSLSVVYFVP